MDRITLELFWVIKFIKYLDIVKYHTKENTPMGKRLVDGIPMIKRNWCIYKDYDNSGGGDYNMNN